MKSQAPFLDVSSFIVKEVEESLTSYETIPGNNIPFLTLYESDTDGLIDPQNEAYVTFLNELYDEEFDTAIENLVDEAATIHESQLVNETSDPQTDGYHAQRILQQHFAPLAAELETMLGTLETEFRHRDPRQMSDEEIDTTFNRLQPSSPLSPNFEQFWGAIKKVAKSAVGAVKKGVGVLTTLGLGPILNKLKALIKPLLKRVINKAIGKLPPYLQPIAQRLAKRLPFLKETEAGDGGEGEWEGVETGIQHEFDQQVANLLFARDEVEQEMELANAITEQHLPDHYPLAELAEARNRFVDNLQQLKEGEDPTPHIENFLPALLPALRIGIQLAGRKRVVSYLAKFLAKLIQRFVGPKYTPALSQAMVDVGLRLLQMETTPEDEARAVPTAVAATVEETVRRVAGLPDYVLDNQELLEGFALEAFEQAAAANLPQSLPEEVYRKRPDLGQARKYRGIWKMMPGRRRKGYKTYTSPIQIRITPYKVAEVESFAGEPLAEYLEEQLGIAPGEEVEPILHLYEALPGTRLADIARQEEHTAGLGSANRADQLHPLTRQAALQLLGEAGLGRDVEGEQSLNPHATAPGQRFYYLEVPGKRPLTATDPSGKTAPRRRTKLRLIFDFPKNEIRACLFLSEVRAQEIAVKLRQNGHPGIVITRFAQILERRIERALAGRYGRLKLIHETTTPDQWLGKLKQLPALLPQMIAGRLKAWLLKGLSDYLKQHGRDFISAAENTADGVTLLITLSNPPGFAQLRQALKGKGLSLAMLNPLLKMPDGSPTVKFKVLAGYHHE